MAEKDNDKVEAPGTKRPDLPENAVAGQEIQRPDDEGRNPEQQRAHEEAEREKAAQEPVKDPDDE